MMKRTTILALLYAVLISMVVVSFSLFYADVPVKNATIGTKVFDISLTTTMDDTRYVENTPSWLFSAFNTSAISGNNYDLNVQIVLSTSSTAGLQVGLYDQSNTQLALASFSGNTANLFALTLFPQGTVAQKMLTLKYIYNSLPISSSNIPFAANSVTSSVTVWGTKTVIPDQEIIDNVLANPWCSTYLVPRNNFYLLQVRTSIPGDSKSVWIWTWTLNNNYNGTITINFNKPAGTLTVYRNGTVANSFTGIDTSTYVNPNAVVIQNTNVNPSRSVVISQLDLNGTVYAGPYLQSTDAPPVLFKNFVCSEDGSFIISFEYLTKGQNAEFSINVGYES